jgi:hypothetical protein
MAALGMSRCSVEIESLQTSMLLTQATSNVAEATMMRSCYYQSARAAAIAGQESVDG